MRKIVGAAVAAALCWTGTANAQGTTRLTLAEAVRLAAGTAPAVEAAGYRVAGAEARAHETRANLLPTLDVAAAYFNRSATLASTGF